MNFQDGLLVKKWHEPEEGHCIKVPHLNNEYKPDNCRYCKHKKGTSNCGGYDIEDIFISSWEADEIKRDEAEERDND